MFTTNIASSFLISNSQYLIIPLFLSFIGILGIMINYKNILISMLSLELIYLGVIAFLLFYFSIYVYDPKLQLYSIILLIIAVSESAIGLGILIVLYRFGKSIDIFSYQELRG